MCVHIALSLFQNTQFSSDKIIRRLQGLLCSSAAIDISLEYERSWETDFGPDTNITNSTGG